jgi:hypothetical protein
LDEATSRTSGLDGTKARKLTFFNCGFHGQLGPVVRASGPFLFAQSSGSLATFARDVPRLQAAMGSSSTERTPANILIANSSEPHVVLKEAASRRHAYFAAQFLVHVRQPCWRLIALAYGRNVFTAFALRQTSMLSDMGY